MSLLRYRIPLLTLSIAAAACGGSSESAAPPPPGPAARLIVSGDQQTGVVGKALTDLLGVRVVDATGRGVPAMRVTFEVQGGGSTGGASLTTNDSGLVRTAWTLGTKTSDAQSVTVRVPDSPTSLNATLTATARADAASALKVVSAPTSAQNGVPMSQPVVVALADQYGNDAPDAGISITASVAQRTVRGNATATTDGTGRASFAGLAIVGKTGAASIAFTANQLTASAPITLTAGPAKTIEAVSSQSMTGDASTTGSSIRVRVLDESANPVPGASIAFNFAGTITNVTSDADGIAALSGWTFPSKVGTYVVTASLADIPVVSFQITSKLGGPSKIVPINIPTSKPAGTSWSITGRVVDAAGNVVPNATVTWTAPAGGAVSLPTSTADAFGVVETFITMPKVVGVAKFGVTFASGATQEIPITIVPGSPARVTVSQTTLSVSVGGSATVRATIADEYGNVLPNLLVKANPADNRPLGTVTPAAMTDASGSASFTFVAGVYSGAQTLVIWPDYTVSALVRVNISGGTRGLFWLQGPDVSGGVPFKIAYCHALAFKSDGNPYPGLSVTFSVPAGQGAILSGQSMLTTQTIVTDQYGFATVAWQLPGTGSYLMTITASAALDNNPLVCRVTV